MLWKRAISDGMDLWLVTNSTKKGRMEYYGKGTTIKKAYGEMSWKENYGGSYKGRKKFEEKGEVQVARNQTTAGMEGESHQYT